MICGPCATDNHRDCNGFLKTSLAFCQCADRHHCPKPPTEEERELRQRNDAIVVKAIQGWFRRQEKSL